MIAIRSLSRVCNIIPRSNSTLISRRCRSSKHVLPVALQYVYGETNKVQSEALKEPTEHDVEGIVQDRKESEKEQIVYPFAIYDSIDDAKESEKKDQVKESIKRNKRSRRSRTLSHFEANEENKEYKENVADEENVDILAGKTPEEVAELYRHGTSDPDIPASRVPCSGCGAKLHCQDSKLPGFLPLDFFRKISHSYQKLRQTQCQRCILMKEYNIALKMNVTPEDYPKTISHLKNQKAIIVLIVDLTDFPGSLWPGILDLIGSEKRVILVGNKVDLLPQDTFPYLENIEKAMVKGFLKKCKQDLNRKPTFLESILVSARTGYNVEYLITMIFKNWRDKAEFLGGNVYLLGTTNVGKSSLFNLLMDSDMCDVKALSRIDKATIAPVPGTTLNLLKFPIVRPSPDILSERHSRLKRDEIVIKRSEKIRIANLRKTKSAEYAAPVHPVGQTFWYQADKDVSKLTTTAFEMNLQNPNKEKTKLDFDPREYKDSKWCHDTPGTISEDQVINLFTQEEILKILPNLPILPLTLSVPAGFTVFIGGVGRLDVLEGPEDPRWEKQPLILTLFASGSLPINVIPTDQAEDYYKEGLAKNSFVVPDVSNPDRLTNFPDLKGQDLTVYGISNIESACDIVLSSVCWFSVTTRVTLLYKMRAWTPGGKGIFLRDPSFLPFAVNLKGRRIRGTNFYGESRLFLP